MVNIVITGPESTGKTTLAKQLAAYFQTIWVPEYARTYVGQLNRACTLADVLYIAQQQVLLKKQLLLKANHVVICDTDLVVTKIWAEYVFGTCPTWINQQLQQQLADLYLLLQVDVPWMADGQRTHFDPKVRCELFQRYQQTLTTLNVPFTIIKGNFEERFQQAVQAIKHRAIILD